MKVTFDSNVWQLVVMPEENPSDADAANFLKIHQAILDGRITPFLSETIFTLEGLMRKERKKFLGDYRAKIKTTEQADDTRIKIGMSIGPDEDAHPGNHEYLAKYLDTAAKMGFKLVHIARIAGLVNKDAREHLVQLSGQELGDYLDRGHEASRRIDELGSGTGPLMKILEKYAPTRNRDLHSWIASAPDSETNAIAKAVAEWADADSVAAHIAIQGDYFCTRDQAKGAGQSSVLSASNVTILEREFGFKKVAPAELADLL
jgi:hypothetical protein